MDARTYDHALIASLREARHTWQEIAGRLGGDPKRLRQAHSRWCQRQAQSDDVEIVDGGRVVQKWLRGPEGTVHVKMGATESLSDSAAAFWEDAREAFLRWQPPKDPPGLSFIGSQPNLAVLSIYDAHFGMRADADEIGSLGEDQDLSIISRAFDATVERLVALSRVYAPERYLIPLGHDFSHVNQYMGKAMTTRSGTEQDVDSRLWKIHRAVCESAVRMIDCARSTGRPVDVVLVPGNHDPDENFKLGEFLRAWYRHDVGTGIMNTPTQHKYYGYGSNAFMLTHGEHYMKSNGQSPLLVFANECPPDIWARGYKGGRYILSGHLHARRAGRYTPTSDVSEEAGIITYVLPGLTATDDWHQRSNYRHQRAATLQIFSREGGLFGHHEINPTKVGNENA